MVSIDSINDGDISNIVPPEQVEAVAKQILDKSYEKACERLRHDFYDVAHSYLDEHYVNFECAIWDQISRQIIEGYARGKWSKYDHKGLRSTLLREHKEEIIAQLNNDLVEENEKLKNALKREREYNNQRY